MIDCTDRNVMFVAFDQEEIGLIGSGHFASYLKNNGYDLHSMINLDMIGWDGDGDKVIEVGAPSAGLYDFYDDLADSSGFDYTLVETGLAWSDNGSFLDEGYPCLMFISEYTLGDMSPYNHSPGDTYDTVDFQMLEHVVILANLGLKELTLVE
jgi:Zn-dependent M28 family amino/carboxypeptidase